MLAIKKSLAFGLYNDIHDGYNQLEKCFTVMKLNNIVFTVFCSINSTLLSKNLERKKKNVYPIKWQILAYSVTLRTLNFTNKTL